MKQEKGPSLQKNIYANMQERDTEELTAIWAKNDRSKWSDAAFDAIKDILLERTGSLPAQENKVSIEVNPQSETDMVDSYTKAVLQSRAIDILLGFCLIVVAVFGITLLIGIVMEIIYPSGNIAYENIWFPILCAVSIVPLYYLRRRYRRSTSEAKQHILRRMQEDH